MIDFQKPDALDKEIILIKDKIVMTKMDKEGILEFANEYFVEVSGYEEFELMGKSIFCVQHPDMPDVLFKWMWEKLNKQENFNFPIKALAKNGKFYWSIADFSFKVDENNETLAIFNRRKFASREVISYFSNLYEKIKSIEVESGIVLAEKYLIGHLEEKEKSIKEIVLDLDSDISIKKMVNEHKTISKITTKDHPVFEKNPVQINIDNLPNTNKPEPIVEVTPKFVEKPKESIKPEEELSIQERIDRIREKANRVSNQTIKKEQPKVEIKKPIQPQPEVVKVVKEELKVEDESNEIVDTPIEKKGKKSIFQKLFGKTDEEIEEERKRREE